MLKGFCLETREEPLTADAITIHSLAKDIEGEGVGYAQLRVDTRQSEAELANLLVLKENRGQGVGGALLREVEKNAASRGVKRIVSWVREEGDTVFFKNRGYKVDGHNVEKDLTR